LSAVFKVSAGLAETAGGELGPGILQPASAAATICEVVATALGHLDGAGTKASGFCAVTGFETGAGFDVLTEVLAEVAIATDFCSVAVAHTKTWLSDIEESEAKPLADLGEQAALAACPLNSDESSSASTRVDLSFTVES
jgi:hypothetical protein